MGTKSKSTCTCLANLQKAPAKIYKATVKEYSDVEDSPYEPNPDDDMWDLATVSKSSDGGKCLHKEARAFHIAFNNEHDLDLESDVDGSEFDEADIFDNAQLLTFSNVLAKAQAAVVEAEKRADASKSGGNLKKGTLQEVNIISVQITEKLLLKESKLSSVHG